MKAWTTILILQLTALHVDASVIHVPADHTSIQNAIHSATNGDTVLVADGHYFERLRFFGKGVLVASEFILDGDSSHIVNTIIDADTTVLGPSLEASVVLFVDSEDSLAGLQGLTIQNGTGVWHYSVGSYWGAGVYCQDASPTIKNCVFRENHADGVGGGMYLRGASAPYISHCKFYDNEALGWGGGMAANAGTSPTIRNCWFRNNKNSGVYLIEPDAVVEDCLIEANEDGGMWVNAGYTTDQTFTNCTFRDNEGTGVVCTGGLRITYDHCVFEGNRGRFGGGHDSRNTNVEFRNCLFRGNSALVGAGIRRWGRGSLLVENCTFVQNVSEIDILNLYTEDSSSSLVVSSSILAFNTAEEVFRCDSVFQPELYSVNVYGNSGVQWEDCASDHYLINGNISADPLFCDTAAGDFRIGANSYCAPDHSSTGSLIGAFGVGCPSVYRTILVHADGSGDAPTIQAGIDSANVGDTVLLTDGVYTGTGNRDVRFGGKGIVVASMNGPEATVVDAQAQGRGFVFDSGEDSTSVLSGVSIKNGFVGESDTLGGAGVLCYLSSPTIRDCEISYNTVLSDVGGGGLYIGEASPSVENCTIEWNTAPTGAGGRFVSSVVSMKDCVLAKNSASVQGGAIDCNAGLLEILGCSLVGNSAPDGSGLYLAAAAIGTLDRAILAFSYGAPPVGCEGGSSIELSCSDVFGNTAGDWVGCIYDQAGIRGNLSVDPSFCDTANGEYFLKTSSECAPEFSDCGVLIGALGPRCSWQRWPDDYRLAQNYPNPFNAATTIVYSLPVSTHTIVSIYNILGQEVVRLFDEWQLLGEHELEWRGLNSNGKPVSTGVYFYRIAAGDYTATRKMLLLK